MLVKEQVKQTLGELLTLEYGTGLPEPMRTGEGFPVYGSSGLVGRHAHSIAQGPGIIVGRKGTVGAIIWSVDDFWPIDTTYYVKARANYSLRWLYWCLSSLPLKNLDSSTGVPGLNRHDIYAVEVIVPPLPEQRRIATILDTVDAAIQQTEALIAKLKQMKAGLLHDLLTRGLDAHSHLRDPVAHPEQFKDSPLGRIPQAWNVEPCRSLCSAIVVGIVVKPSQYYVSEGIPALRSANVREGGIDPNDLVFISEQSNKLLAKSAIHAGDVLTVRTGYPGTSCVVSPAFDGANCIDVIISRPLPQIAPNFLATWINSDFGKGQVLRAQGGLAQQHFNVSALQKLLVSVPSICEQLEIMSILDAHSARVGSEEAYRDKLKQLKKGLMADLLTGRVRVTREEITA